MIIDDISNSCSLVSHYAFFHPGREAVEAEPILDALPNLEQYVPLRTKYINLFGWLCINILV